jgi:hypothetical protein
MRRFVSIAIVVAIASLGCGKSPEQKQAEEIKKSAEQMQKGADDMAKGLADMAKGLSTMAGGDPNQKPVDPVSFKDLQTLLPDVSGWEKGKPTGERMTSPVNYAETSVTYKKGDAEISQKIVDSAFNQMLTAPLAMAMMAGYSKETSDGYEKAVKIGENPGWEKWNSADKEGELNVVVNKRFIVTIEGHRLDDPKQMRDVLDKTDLKKLAALAK